MNAHSLELQQNDRDNIVADFTDGDSFGYLIQKVAEGFRFVSLVPGEDDEFGPVTPTIQKAAESAVNDWEETGDGYLGEYPWGRQLLEAELN